jgi:hypothetical protein
MKISIVLAHYCTIEINLYQEWISRSLAVDWKISKVYGGVFGGMEISCICCGVD